MTCLQHARAQTRLTYLIRIDGLCISDAIDVVIIEFLCERGGDCS